MEANFITTVLDERIQYIAIKVIEKEAKDVKGIIGGLFKGIITHKDAAKKEHTFILTEQKNEKDKDVISGVNREYYDILSISIVGDKHKVNAFATKDTKDQERMYSIAVLCMETLKVDGMVVVNQDQLVNTSLYTTVPSDISNKKVVKTTTSYNNSRSVYTPKPKVVPQPTFFESKDVKVEDIESMKLKLDLALAGTFEPLIPDVNEGDEEKSTTYARGGQYGNMGHAFGY